MTANSIRLRVRAHALCDLQNYLASIIIYHHKAMVPTLLSEEETANFSNTTDGPAKMVVAKKGGEMFMQFCLLHLPKATIVRGGYYLLFFAKTTGCSISKLSRLLHHSHSRFF